MQDGLPVLPGLAALLELPGPWRLLPKVEKVCWRFKGLGLRDPLPPAENPPSLWGSGWGLSAPKDIGSGKVGDTSSACVPATAFLTILISSSLLLLLSHLFLISQLSPCYSLCTLFAVCFSGSGASIQSLT